MTVLSVQAQTTIRALRRRPAGRADGSQRIAKSRCDVAPIPAVGVGFALNATLAVAAAEGTLAGAGLGAAYLGGVSDGRLAAVAAALGAVSAAGLAIVEAAIATGAAALATVGAGFVGLADVDGDTQARVRLAALAGAVARLLAADAVGAGGAGLALLTAGARIARLEEAIAPLSDLAFLANATAVLGAYFALGGAISRAAAGGACHVGLADAGRGALARVAREPQGR